VDSIIKFNDIPAEDLEIIVVDNSDPDEGVELQKLLDARYHSSVRFFQNQNFGYGHGNNVGVKLATGDIILIMNPDVRLTESLFGRTLQHFENQEVASVGYRQINNVSDFSFYRFPELHFPLIYSIINRRDNKKYAFSQYKNSLSGAFVFFRKADFVLAGRYDENMFMYLEEPDIARRINNLGKRIVFDPGAAYTHLMEHKDDYNQKLLDIGTNSIAIYFTKHQLNLRRYITSRIIELQMHKFIFTVFGNRQRVRKAQAYINSLEKAYDYQNRYLNNK